MATLNIPQDISDTEIIRRVLAGEIDLYAAIVKRYNSYLFKVGKLYGYNHDDIEDLMQETYVSAYTHLKDFEGRSSFKTWIVQIMLHQCYHKKHKFSFQKEKPDSENLEADAESAPVKKVSDGVRAVQQHELRGVIENAILNLPDEYRMVFSLREITGLSTLETAELLSITEDNAKVRLNRAKKMLQEKIGESYTDSELFEFNLIYCDVMVDRVMKAIKELKQTSA